MALKSRPKSRPSFGKFGSRELESDFRRLVKNNSEQKPASGQLKKMDTLIKLLPDSIRSIPVHMDFEGQRRAERTFQIIIVLFAVVGFVWGYICQQFSQTMYILGAGFALSCVLTLPPWPMYRLKPLHWQKARNYGDENDVNSSSPQAAAHKGKKKK